MRTNYKKSKEKFKCKQSIQLNFPIKCQICEKEIKSLSGIATHVVNKHEHTYSSYLKEYHDIDLEKINTEFDSKRTERKEKQLSGLKKYVESIKGLPIKERFSAEKYESFRKSMKGVFSLEWFIKKYGEDDGRKKYTERSENISKTTYFKNYNKSNKSNWSKISQELFWNIYEAIKDEYLQIYFGELNHEFGCGTNNNFDFVVLDNKKIIEFNGDSWHANPTVYNENDIPLKFLKETSKDIWEKDKEKIEKVVCNGYKVKIVWEKDYLKDKNKVLLDCINFILNV